MKFIDMIGDSKKEAKGKTLVLGTLSLMKDKMYGTDANLIYPNLKLKDKKGRKLKSTDIEEVGMIINSIYNQRWGVKVCGVNKKNFQVFKEGFFRLLNKYPETESILLGCTEIPLFFKFENCRLLMDINRDHKYKIINPSSILSRKLFDECDLPLPKEIEKAQMHLNDIHISSVLWYKPLGFKVKTLEDANKIQQKIIDKNTRILKSRKGSSGSYFHLPTIFFVNIDTIPSKPLNNIEWYEEGMDLDEKINDYIKWAEKNEKRRQHSIDHEMTAAYSDLFHNVDKKEERMKRKRKIEHFDRSEFNNIIKLKK
jgi:hypothetical protein